MDLNSTDVFQEIPRVDEGHETDNILRKSIRWEDQELMNVIDFESITTNQGALAGEANNSFMAPQGKTDEVVPVNSTSDVLPLLTNLTEIAMDEVNSSRICPTSPVSHSSSREEEDEKYAALTDLITHLEDTAALLREQLAPTPKDTSVDISSVEQINFILRYQFVLVSFCQAISILLLTLFDHLSEEGDTEYHALSKSTGSVLQILNMLLVVFATVVLSKQMLKYKVEGSFLAQTYLSTVLTFAGLYFIIYRFQPDSWEFGSVDRMEESIAVLQFIKMLYLSVSAATLCGAANIQPRAWYAVLLLCFQSLVNFVYFASILAQTIGNYHSYTVQVRRSESMSKISQARSQNKRHI